MVFNLINSLLFLLSRTIIVDQISRYISEHWGTRKKIKECCKHQSKLLSSWRLVPFFNITSKWIYKSFPWIKLLDDSPHYLSSRNCRLNVVWRQPADSRASTWQTTSEAQLGWHAPEWWITPSAINFNKLPLVLWMQLN